MGYGPQNAEVEEFSGLVTSPPPYKLVPGEARRMKNLFIKRRGSLYLRGFFFERQGLSGFANNTTFPGFIRFRGNGQSYIVYGKSAPSGGTYAFNEATGVTTLIDSAVFYDGVIMAGLLIYLTGAEGSFPRAWDGDTASPPFNIGVAPPSTVPTVALAAGSGPLDTTGLAPYRYYVTFIQTNGIGDNTFTVESNAKQSSLGGPESSASIAPKDQSVEVTLPTRTGFFRRIYRIGGLLTRPTLIAQVSDDSTTLYTDSIPDTAVGTIYLSNAHDAPPLGAERIGTFKNRLVLSKGTTVYVSSLGEPDYYPEFVSDPATDGFIFFMDGDNKNPVVSLSESGSAGIIHRKEDLWLLTGEDTDSFALTQVCNIGTLSDRSSIMCGNIYTWQAPDGMIWGLDGSGPIELGLDIEDTLRALPQADLSTACSCYFRRQYHYCCPRLSGETIGGGSGGRTIIAPAPAPLYLVYDFVYGKWLDFSDKFMAATQLYSGSGTGDEDEILMATKSGYEGYLGTATAGIFSNFNPDPGPSGSIYGAFGFEHWGGDLTRGKDLQKANGLRVMGTYVPSGNQKAYATVWAYADNRTGGQTITQRRYQLNPTTEGLLLDTDLDASLNAQRLSVWFYGSGEDFQLDSMELYGNTTRQGNT